MKLIIDIDEDVRIAISQMGLLRIPNEMQKRVDKAIQHGTPLEDIKAEIKFITDSNGVTHIHRDDVFKIIDKYRNEVSE